MCNQSAVSKTSIGEKTYTYLTVGVPIEQGKGEFADKGVWAQYPTIGSVEEEKVVGWKVRNEEDDP